MFDVCGIGAYCLDYLGLADAFPSEDEKMELADIEIQGGGNVATALVAVARLGGSSCYHGVIGNDANTGLVIRGLTDEQVDVSSLKSVEGANPLAFIIINRKNSSRTILYTKNRVPVFGRADVDASAIRDSRVLLIDFYHEEASLAASEIAREAGIPVVVDAESVKPLSTKIMANATHLIASKSFARRFAGLPEGGDMSSAAERIAGLTGCPFVCVTLGEQGAVALERHSGRTYRQRAYRVEVVDTTGAGDVFHGAFAYFLASRRPVEEILRLSSACAALACTRMGGRKGAPTMSELTDFLTRM